jgi:hypothetical protein
MGYAKLRALRVTCSSGKVSYPNERVARAVVATKRLPNAPVTAGAIYKCHECGEWHATSNHWGTAIPVTARAR